MLKYAYRHYNRLIDVSFWILLVITGWGVLGYANILSPALKDPWHPINMAMLAVSAAVKLGMLALILVDRLRDEYAQRLWLQAAGTYGKCIVLLPFAWISLIVLANAGNSGTGWLRLHPDASLIPDRSRLPNANGSIGIYQFEAINFVVSKLTSYFPLMFAAFYKMHRWQDRD